MRSSLKEYPKRKCSGEIIIGACVVLLLSITGIIYAVNSGDTKRVNQEEVTEYYHRKANQTARSLNRLMEINRIIQEAWNADIKYQGIRWGWMREYNYDEQPRKKVPSRQTYYDDEDDDEDDDDDGFDEKWDYGYGVDYDEYGERKY